MSRIVKPTHVDWSWRTTDDGVPDAIVSKGGQSVTPLASYATDAAGNPTDIVLAGREFSLLPSKPTAVIFGDSMTFYNSPFVGITSATRSGNVATVNATAHGFGPGQIAIIAGYDFATCSAYNGQKTVATRIDADNFTFPIDSSAPATATAGSGLTAQVAPLEYQDAGYFSWFQAIAKQPFRWLHNGGTGGAKTSDLLLRVQTDVIDYAPGYCFVMAGINDVLGSVAVPTITTNLQAIYARLLGAGIRVVALTVLPLGSGHASFNATTSNAICEINQWIMAYAAVTPGMIAVDTYAAIADPAANGAAVAANLLSDGIHPSATGGRLMGVAIDTALTGRIPVVPCLISNTADSRGQSANSNQMFDNPVGKTTTGGTLNTGFSGTAGAEWTVGRVVGTTTATASMASRTDGVGNDLLLASLVSAGATDWYQVNAGTMHARFSPGDYIEAILSFKSTNSTQTKSFSPFLVMTVDGVTYNKFLMRAVAVSMPQNDLDLVYYVKTRIPTGAALTALVHRFYHLFSAADATGNQSVRFGRLSVRKVSA